MAKGSLSLLRYRGRIKPRADPRRMSVICEARSDKSRDVDAWIRVWYGAHPTAARRKPKVSGEKVGEQNKRSAFICGQSLALDEVIDPSKGRPPLAGTATDLMCGLFTRGQVLFGKVGEGGRQGNIKGRAYIKDITARIDHHIKS